MYKIIVLLALVAVVYSLPSPTQTNAAGEPKTPENSAVKATEQATNGEIDPKNEKEELEGAEFGWGFKKFGFKKFGWGYPIYKSHYYPVHYYPADYYDGHYDHYYNHYPSYNYGEWW